MTIERFLKKDVTVPTPDRVEYLTLGEAKDLPGMLRKIVPAMLAHHDYYAVTIDGAKVLYMNIATARERDTRTP